MRIPAAPHPPEHLVLPVVGILSILIAVSWDLIIVLIFLSLMMYVEDLFMIIFASSIFSHNPYCQGYGLPSGHIML